MCSWYVSVFPSPPNDHEMKTIISPPLQVIVPRPRILEIPQLATEGLSSGLRQPGSWSQASTLYDTTFTLFSWTTNYVTFFEHIEKPLSNS